MALKPLALLSIALPVLLCAPAAAQEPLLQALRQMSSGEAAFHREDYAQAEVFYRRALELREQALGAGHLDTAQSANNLGVMLALQGRHAEAEALFRRVLAAMEVARGNAHPDTAGALNNVGAALEQQGRHAEAKAFYGRALAIRKAKAAQ
jgi:tetratricopeptide (TPR) repeat protein